MRLSRVVPFSLSFVIGCGGGGGSGIDGHPRIDADPNAPDSDPNAPDAAPNAPDANPNAPDADTGTWETLISANWSLGPGQEGYWCATKTMTEDVYAHMMRPMAPLGTHHTVIGIGAPHGP